jgi:hypothetical protein
MPTINQLPTVTQVSGGDQLPLFVTNQGDARRCSVTTLIGYACVILTQAVAPFLVRFFKRMVTSYFLKMAATFCFNRVYP